MRRFVVTIAAATVFLTGAPFMGASVRAASIVAPGAIRAAADSLNVVESVQFFWLGHDYCWFDDGWNGPGWYWCDYGGRVGVGWGGGYGWHNWRGGHPGGDHKAVNGDHKAVNKGGPSGKAGPSGLSGQAGKGGPSGPSRKGGPSGKSGPSGQGGAGSSGKDNKQH